MKRIIKFGGSLLDCPGIGQALQVWLADNQDLQNVIICGGGSFVDCVRRWDQVHGLSDEAAHWISVQALSITGRLLAEMLRAADVTDSLQQAMSIDSQTIIFQPEIWLRSQTELPMSWDLTSDSIAAAIAIAVDSKELVLMKSAIPKAPIDPTGLTETGFIDPLFRKQVHRLKCIRVVNLRNPSEKEAFWWPKCDNVQ